MAQSKQLDNSTGNLKAMLRRQVLEQMEAPPVVMETHGGAGALFNRVYRGLEQGVVFEKDPAKCELLALQRPTWAVYEADCLAALQGGVGGHLEVNLLDMDPYGEPWPVLNAFLESERPRARVLWVVVNDELRQTIRLGRAWSVRSLEHVVSRRGNDLYSKYLDVCRELIKEKAEAASYELTRFSGYYCGAMQQMTHYAARLELA